MTLVIEEPQNTELLTPAAAVAVCKVLETRGLSPKIKWVNDIFLKGKKICGILCERIVSDNKIAIAVGIGINLTTSVFPDELTSAGSVNLNCDKNSLAVEISKEFIETIKRNSITAEYRKRLFFLGKTVEFNRNGAKHIAEAVDINEKCNLIVRYPDESLETLSSGEISIKI